MTSRIRAANLADVFDCNRNKQMNACLAGFAVLLEDLRIEVFGMYEETLSEKTRVDYKVQQIYFFRKIIGTLLEIAKTLRLLDGDPDFSQLIKSRFNSKASGRWSEAVSFFTSNEQLLKKVRNDVSGHFGTQAAIFAVDNMNRTVIGKVELVDGMVKLHFANEIAATALLHHLPGPDTDSKLQLLGNIAVEGLKHARNALGLILHGYLWERFGR